MEIWKRFVLAAIVFILSFLNVIFLEPTMPTLSAFLLIVGISLGAWISNGGIVDRSFWWWVLVWLVIFGGAYWIQFREWH